MKVKLIRRLKYGPGAGERCGQWAEAGTILSHPDSWRLVGNGDAVPADEECRAKCGMTDEQMRKVQIARDKLEAGIAPEDYEAYEQGLMSGYNPDGSWVPGPNAIQEDDDDDE